MISPQQIQERRRDELLRRQLGPQLLAAMADPAITDIIVNEDGRVGSRPTAKGCSKLASSCRQARSRASSAP